MITLDDIKSQWAEDSKIDADLLDEESLKIPQLHSKYLKYLSDVRLLKLKKEHEYKSLLRDKFEYYTGKAEPEVYVQKPFDHKVLKNDLDKYLDADDELIKSLSKLDYYQTMLSYLDSILKTILNRTYQIKNAIEFMRFTAGYD